MVVNYDFVHDNANNDDQQIVDGDHNFNAMPSDSSEYDVDDPVPYDLDYNDTDPGTGDQDDETI